MKVTFIGLGIMGSRMAYNLLKNGIDLTVYNRTPSVLADLVGAGAKKAVNINDAVKDADIIFSMLSTPEVVESVFFGTDGAISKMKKSVIWVDCSTVNPSFSIRAKEEAELYGIRFADCPVAGTLPHAEKAELVFFVGADDNTLTELLPLLKYMGKKSIHIGEVSKGSSFKMLVNIMLAQSMVIFSEAILLGEKMGIDKEFLLNVVPGLVVSAPFTKIKSEMIRSGNYNVQFPLEWMYKDLHLAAITAYENNQAMFLTNITKELFAKAKKSGMGRLDFAAVHKYLADR